MNSVSVFKRQTVSKQIKIVNETYIISATSGLKPVMEAKEFAETTSTASYCGNGTWDKNRFSTTLQEIKKMAKIIFGQLGLLKSSAIFPMWIITLLMEDGSDGSKPWSFFRMSLIVAQGKQWVTALKNHTFLAMKSSAISVVWKSSGQGGVSRRNRAPSASTVCAVFTGWGCMVKAGVRCSERVASFPAERFPAGALVTVQRVNCM